MSKKIEIYASQVYFPTPEEQDESMSHVNRLAFNQKYKYFEYTGLVFEVMVPSPQRGFSPVYTGVTVSNIINDFKI